MNSTVRLLAVLVVFPLASACVGCSGDVAEARKLILARQTDLDEIEQLHRDLSAMLDSAKETVEQDRFEAYNAMVPSINSLAARLNRRYGDLSRELRSDLQAAGISESAGDEAWRVYWEERNLFRMEFMHLSRD